MKNKSLDEIFDELLNERNEKINQADTELEENAERAILDDHARTVKALYEAYRRADFTKRQAFELVLMTVADMTA